MSDKRKRFFGKVSIPVGASLLMCLVLSGCNRQPQSEFQTASRKDQEKMMKGDLSKMTPEQRRRMEEAKAQAPKNQQPPQSR